MKTLNKMTTTIFSIKEKENGWTEITVRRACKCRNANEHITHYIAELVSAVKSDAMIHLRMLGVSMKIMVLNALRGQVSVITVGFDVLSYKNYTNHVVVYSRDDTFAIGDVLFQNEYGTGSGKKYYKRWVKKPFEISIDEKGKYQTIEPAPSLYGCKPSLVYKKIEEFDIDIEHNVLIADCNTSYYSAFITYKFKDAPLVAISERNRNFAPMYCIVSCNNKERLGQYIDPYNMADSDPNFYLHND